LSITSNTATPECAAGISPHLPRRHSLEQQFAVIAYSGVTRAKKHSEQRRDSEVLAVAHAFYASHMRDIGTIDSE